MRHGHRVGGPGPVADHSHVLNILGESFRLREKRQLGLFPSQQYLAVPPEEAGDNYPG